MNEKNFSELFVFLLYSDGTFAWVNPNDLSSAESPENILGESAWNRCGPDDQDVIRDGLAKLMLDHETGSFDAIIHNIEGQRLMVSMERLPIVQPSQHAVVGWCRRLSDEVLALTKREREILELVCDELTSEQIGKQLHISSATVETHRQNIAKKLGTSSVVGQVRAAIRGGLINP
jgi:LuxR family transcriptional regulator of spore coat protein